MPLCPYCGAQVQPEDIFCGNCGGDLREATDLEEVPPAELVKQEEGALLPAEEAAEGEEKLPPPPEALPAAEAPAWTSPLSQTLWIVVIVVLLMLLCCCGALSLIALARILGQS